MHFLFIGPVLPVHRIYSQGKPDAISERKAVLFLYIERSIKTN